MSTAIIAPRTNGNGKEPKTLRDHLESAGFAAQMAKVLPKHLTPERMARVAATAMTKTPKLAECDHASFFAAMLTLSQIGLEPDGRMAHLIPFFNNKRGVMECQLIIDWKGLAQLAYRSGQISALHADVIYTGDDFAYDLGQISRHIPFFLRKDAEKPAKRGDVIGAYAMAIMKDGVRIAALMEEADIELIRARSKSPNNGPWVTDRNEMRKKTPFRRMSKWLPLESEKYREALDADDASDPINVTPEREPVNADRFIAQAEPDPMADAQARMEAAPEPQAVERKTRNVTPKAAAQVKDTATVDGDLVARIQAALDSCGGTLEHIKTDLYGRNEIEADGKPTVESITSISNIPRALLEAYLENDANGLKEAVNFAKQA